MFRDGEQNQETLFPSHVSEGGQTRKHCFLAMFRDGEQNQETLFPSHVSEGGQTRKHCFRQTTRHTCQI
jgi:hypothetical protein